MPHGSPDHPTIRIGTRGSALALAQTDLVLARLRAAWPDRSFAPVVINTRGDRDRAPLAEIGGQGVFVREIERALLDGRIDLAVHSYKDVPPLLAEGCAVVAVPERADVRDALISRDRRPLAALPAGARIGTGSARRAGVLRHLRPDVEVEAVRGNVDTRIRRVRAGDLDAVVLAVAGLERLGRLGEAAELFDPAVMVAAAAQGALALEARADNHAVAVLCAPLDHPPSRSATDAERAFLGRLGAGCRLGVGAWASVAGEALTLTGLLIDEGSGRVAREQQRGSVSEAAATGARLAERMLATTGFAPGAER